MSFGPIVKMTVPYASAALHYDLACCECLLGELEVARARLKHAVALDPDARQKALDDTDLAALSRAKR